MDDENVSMRESEQDYNDQIDSIHQVVRKTILVENHPLDTSDLDKVIWQWMDQNDHEVIERNSRGYSDSGWIDDDTPILAALYCLGLIDLTSYDSDELFDLESLLSDYAMNSTYGVNNAFRTYKTKL